MSEHLNNNIEILKKVSGCNVELVNIPPLIKSQIDVESVMFKFTKKGRVVNLIIPSISADFDHRSTNTHEKSEDFLYAVKQIMSILESNNQDEIIKLKTEMRGGGHDAPWPEILWPLSFFIDTSTHRIIIMRYVYLVTEYDECLSLLVEGLKKIEGVVKVEVRKRLEDKDNDVYFISCHIDDLIYPGITNSMVDCHSDVETHEMIIQNVITTIHSNKIRNTMMNDSMHFNEEIHTQQ
jgi:hypothetical protein